MASVAQIVPEAARKNAADSQGAADPAELAPLIAKLDEMLRNRRMTAKAAFEKLADAARGTAADEIAALESAISRLDFKLAGDILRSVAREASR